MSACYQSGSCVKLGLYVQELSAKVADLKSQGSERAGAHRVSFAPPDQQFPQQQLQYQQPQQPQYQQQQQPQQPHYQQQQQPQQQQFYGTSTGPQPALMWDQNMSPADCRQSGAWPQGQIAQGSPGEAAAAAQLPQLLQKLQRTQEKLETRDASARKYKVGWTHCTCDLQQLANGLT